MYNKGLRFIILKNPKQETQQKILERKKKSQI
jgi:hypothetical protein